MMIPTPSNVKKAMKTGMRPQLSPRRKYAKNVIKTGEDEAMTTASDRVMQVIE